MSECDFEMSVYGKYPTNYFLHWLISISLYNHIPKETG